MSEVITAEEIKEIRGFYGLTQKSFAQLLGIGPASMVRYEQGSQPSKANSNLIRAARHPEFMMECVERDGDLIPRAQREKATQVIYACISFEPEEGEGIARAKGGGKQFPSKMDEVYHYTIQQEILNEQAANIACDLLSYMIEKNIDPRDEEHFASATLIQVLDLKRLLISDGSDDDEVLEEIRGHFKYLEEVISCLYPSGDAEVSASNTLSKVLFGDWTDEERIHLETLESQLAELRG